MMTTLRPGISLVMLLAAGIISFPLVAAVLDGPATEDAIVPVHLVLMAVIGAVVGHRLPGLAGSGATSARSVGVGACVGVATALAAAALFFVLL